MINHQGALKQQLKKALNNVNKKYTILRKELTKVIQVFENNNIPIFPYQVLFGLFKILSETGSARSILAFFPFFNQVIALGFANSQMSKQILTVLIQLRAMPKYQSTQNQNKLQQLLIQLISKQSISVDYIQFSHQIINALSSLKNSTNKTLWQKQANAISQITQFLISSYQQSIAQGKHKVLADFFKDLIILGKKQSPNWFTQAADPFIAYYSIIQIFDSKFILQSRQEWKQCFQALVPFLRKKILQISETSQPTVSLNHIKLWQLSPQHKLILMFKVACKYSTIFHEGFEVLEEIIKLITQKSHLHWKIIAYQCISFIFSQSRWMQALLRSNYAELFNFLLTTEFNILKAIFHDHKQKIDLIGNELQFPKIFSSVLPDFNFTDFPYNSEIKIILRNMEEISNSLYGIYTDVLKIPLHKKYQQDPPLFKTYKFCQKTVFQIIKAVFSRDMNQQILQGILKIAEKFINISGCFGDYSVTIMYMKLLCKYCLPSEFKAIGKRHVQINKMILSTVNCLGGLLNTACWVIVWKALENYSLYYNKYLLSKQHHQPQRQSDVQILFKTMDSIFTQTPKYSDQYLLNIINSLVEVTYECLENHYSDDSKKIFSFERIQQVYKLNLFRIPMIWPALSSSLLCITTSKVAYFRISALNLLNTLIPISLYHLNNRPQHFTTKFNVENYQTLILQPWTNLVKCPFQELKNQMIVALNKIIDYGHILSHGWESILLIVSNMRDSKSLQSIVETFLDKVDNKIMEILLTIDLIERELHDTNQKYLCLTLIWAIGDYSHKHNHPNVLRKIYSILLQPDEMFSLGTEARHSSFYIFAELIVHNCLENSNDFWAEVFEGVQNFCTFGVNKSIQSKDKKLAQDAIKNILVNMIKIYRIFFMVSEQWEDKNLVLKKLQYFYILCASILRFRQTQVYQTLIKQMKQILFAKTEQSLKLSELVLFIEALTQAYIVEKQNKILKCLITYLPADLYEIILRCAPISRQNLGTLYKLVEKIFLIRLEAQQKDIKLAQARIFFQEKQFNEFYKKFHTIIIDNYEEIIPQYMEKLVQILRHLLLYEDYAYLSKMFQYGTSVILNFPSVPPDGLTDLMCKIIFIKFDPIWTNKFGQSKQVPIWYLSSQQLIKLYYQFFTRNKFEACLRIYSTFVKSLLGSQSELILRTATSVQCISFYYQNEIAIANFIIDNFFYNPIYKNDEVSQDDFAKILQKIVQCSKGFNEKDQKNWSKNFYELLFKISNKKYQQQQVQFIQQRQITVIKALFSRINQTLDCFIKSQLKQSSQNSSMITQTKFVLKKLHTLDCQKGIFAKQNLRNFIAQKYKAKIKTTNIFINHPKFHLFILNEWFIQCIKCKNQEIRAIIGDIYQEKNNILMQVQ